MADFLNKLVSLILLFIICIITPLMFLYMSGDKQSEREILNKTKYYLDKCMNADTMTESDLDNMYRDLNSYGKVVDIKFDRMVLNDKGDYIVGDEASAYDEMVYETDNRLVANYLSKYGCSDYEELKGIKSKEYKYILESEDIFRVTVTEITSTKSDRYISNILKWDKEPLEFSLSAMKR